MARAVLALVAVVLIGMFAGCSAGADPSAAQSSSAGASSAAECPPINLLGDAGQRIVLTGTWAGNDGGYYSLLQDGACVWASGTTARYELTFSGTVRHDFTLSIRFARVACLPQAIGFFCTTNHGTAILAVEVSGEDVVLNLVPSSTGETGGGTGLAVSRMDRVSTTTIFPPPTPGT